MCCLDVLEGCIMNSGVWISVLQRRVMTVVFGCVTGIHYELWCLEELQGIYMKTCVVRMFGRVHCCIWIWYGGAS